jgi:hypothetical protein
MTHKRPSGRTEAKIQTREALPGVDRTKEGVHLMCPFCFPTHPLMPNEDAPCGTVLKVTAIQTIIPERMVRMEKLVCLKCHKGDGAMVQYMNGFIHLHECTPGTQLLRIPPRYNAMAGVVYKLPKGLRKQAEKFTGVSQQVREILPDGTETGKIIGYFFLKGKRNATRTPPEPTTG